MKIQNLQQKMVCYWQWVKWNYSKDDPIKFLTQSIESTLCDYSDAYILVTGNITATPNNAVTQVVFKNCAPFKNCRTEIKDLFIDNADFINVTIPMYNLLNTAIIILIHLVVYEILSGMK